MERELKQNTTPAVPNNGASSADGQLLEYYHPASECFRKAWEGLTDDAICTLVGAIDGGTLTRVAVRLISAFPPFRELAAELSEKDRFSLLTDVTLALTLSVGAEFIRRVELSENKGGGITRKWATGGDLTLKDTKDLARSAQPMRRYNFDGLGASAEENSSVILLACAELLDKESIPTANTREGLAKLISGWFNSIPSRADNILREQVRKNLQRKWITEQVDSQPVDYNEDQDDGRRVEKAFHEEYHPEEDWILLAEVRAAVDSLTPKERQVIELFLEGSTQQEMAEKLTVSQPRITQLKASAIKKIKQAKS